MSFAESELGAATLSVGNTLVVDEMYGLERGYARGPERCLMEALLFDGMQGAWLQKSAVFFSGGGA